MNEAYKTCKSKTGSLDKSSLKLLVDQYIDKYGDCYKQEDKWWGDKGATWEESIEKAWKSRFADEKMHGHQYRVAHKLPMGLDIALKDARKPEDFKNFHSLYDWVKSVTDRVKGLGLTTAYDVTRRLGVCLKLKPSMVYLHAGTLVGARKLGIKGHIVPLSAFPKEIQLLDATHAENFLCIYKNLL